MAQSILVIADSGTGKSTSIRTLDPKETFIINIANKPLPFKGYKSKYTQISKENPKGNLTSAASAPGIIKAMKHINDKMTDIKTIVVDDWQYMSSFEYFDRANEKGYDKFTQIAANLAMVAKLPKDLRDDLTVIFLTHSEDSTDINGNRKIKAKTIGKITHSPGAPSYINMACVVARFKLNCSWGGTQLVLGKAHAGTTLRPAHPPSIR